MFEIISHFRYIEIPKFRALLYVKYQLDQVFLLPLNLFVRKSVGLRTSLFPVIWSETFCIELLFIACGTLAEKGGGAMPERGQRGSIFGIWVKTTWCFHLCRT